MCDIPYISHHNFSLAVVHVFLLVYTCQPKFLSLPSPNSSNLPPLYLLPIHFSSGSGKPLMDISQSVKVYQVAMRLGSSSSVKSGCGNPVGGMSPKSRHQNQGLSLTVRTLTRRTLDTTVTYMQRF